ncbi:putative geranyltranstransferase [Aurantimonas manganoxydans SI85-9A1]|uniref:Probable farnesyl diphosphate synthase n=1 Tax=Aurantimonas manganoxydans (strain ATCC BAA-1229 / DSM 21871 / SI85-9A1) TaxID=287752 RepID=Q1YG43_AURMS|nr:farnesyl diphosphate synthase [Aurantimonas manganoxydans]EAS49382.1 putative geranyltranstransferase [Aurantimonas manganoxydans SI85-9A1]
MSQTPFQARLSEAADLTEARLADCLAGAHGSVAGAPARLLAAMRHGALGGGKRLRPFLVIESARLFGADLQAAIGAATALECIHCYSLVHDDLPSMDDDDLRRGKPTVHRAYDEATAILAGDGLLTLAFGLVAGEEGLSPKARVALVALLARDAGAAGMVGGQVLDLAAENAVLSEDEIARMQAMKTGALIAFACEAGAIVADAGAAERARLRRFGEIVGLAFQLADDLLDETADAAVLGKAAGKDRERGKKTLPALHGIDWTRARLDRLVAEAEAELAPFGDKGGVLIEAARFVANRTS